MVGGISAGAFAIASRSASLSARFRVVDALGMGVSAAIGFGLGYATERGVQALDKQLSGDELTTRLALAGGAIGLAALLRGTRIDARSGPLGLVIGAALATAPALAGGAVVHGSGRAAEAFLPEDSRPIGQAVIATALLGTGGLLMARHYGGLSALRPALKPNPALPSMRLGDLPWARTSHRFRDTVTDVRAVADAEWPTYLSGGADSLVPRSKLEDTSLFSLTTVNTRESIARTCSCRSKRWRSHCGCRSASTTRATRSVEQSSRSASSSGWARSSQVASIASSSARRWVAASCRPASLTRSNCSAADATQLQSCSTARATPSRRCSPASSTASNLARSDSSSS